MRSGLKKRSLSTGSTPDAFGLRFQVPLSRQFDIRNQAFAEVIKSIPRGKIATYGQVASAAGYPRYHRAVARFLSAIPPDELPWQRVIGAGGEIKVTGRAASEQRLRLKMEGVTFVGRRVDLERHLYLF